MKEIKLILETEKYPLHIYADGTLSAEIITGKECVGVIWGKMETLKEVKVVEPKFHLGDYAFAGGEFSKDEKAFPNRSGRVVYINPDANATEGKHGFILAEVEKNLPWATGDRKTETSADDSFLNCIRLLRCINSGPVIHYPAVEFCVNYDQKGVGKWFLPSVEELTKCMTASSEMFNGGYWTSSEAQTDCSFRLAVVGGKIQKLLSVKIRS